jgi:hypothetical protein
MIDKVSDIYLSPFQAGSLAHHFYPLGTESSLVDRNAKPITQLHPEMILKMHGPLSPIPMTSLWRDA